MTEREAAFYLDGFCTALAEAVMAGWLSRPRAEYLIDCRWPEAADRVEAKLPLRSLRADRAAAVTP